MRDETIAKNYAEALLALANKANAPEEWGGMIHAVASAIESNITLQRFLAAPQVSGVEKQAILAKALEGQVPPLFIKFLQKLVSNRRQLLVADIAAAYSDLLDLAAGRVHARVTVARAMSDADRDALAAQLTKVLKKPVVPRDGERADSRRRGRTGRRHCDGRQRPSPARDGARKNARSDDVSIVVQSGGATFPSQSSRERTTAQRIMAPVGAWRHGFDTTSLPPYDFHTVTDT